MVLPVAPRSYVLIRLLVVVPLVTLASNSAIAEDAGHTHLDTLTVYGQGEDGYLSGDAGAATRTGTPLLETPQAVRSLPRELLDDSGATRLDQALELASGVSRQNNFGGLWDNFAIRGFAGNENTGPDLLRNGFTANRGVNAPRDLANIERIEVLKGPASSLYGRGEPGGMVNLVTKQPQWQPMNRLTLGAGSDDAYRGSVDLTGPLNENLAYRLNAAVEDKGSFRDYGDSDRQFVAPSLSWRPAPGTQIDYDSEYLRHRTRLDRGVVAVDGELGAIPTSRFLGEPADGPMTLQNMTHQLRLSQMLTTHWDARAGLSYRSGSLEGYSTEASSLEGSTLRRQRRFRDNESRDLVGQMELIGNLTTGSVEHTVLVGVEASRLAFDQFMLRVNPSDDEPYAIDIFAPEYGQGQPVPLPNTDITDTQYVVAAYLQDEMALGDRWRLNVGARFDQFRQRLDNHRTDTTQRQSEGALNPRVGVLYRLTPSVSLYSNASSSFRPNPGIDFMGEAHEPERSKAMEAGARGEWLGGRFSADLAVFHIEKRNVVTSPWEEPRATGKMRSRGMELDLAGRIADAWQLNLAYGFTDAEVRRDADLPRGAGLSNIPRHSGSLLAVYDFSVSGLAPARAGAGLTHVGGRPGDATDSGFRLPSYTTARVFAQYRPVANLRVTLAVDNLFDEEYYASSYSSLWVAPGAPRTYSAQLEWTL